MSHVSLHLKNEWLNFAGLWLLVDVLNKVSLALDASIGNLANFLRVEGLPRLVVQVLEEGHDVDRVDKVDEGVPDVAAVVQVQRKIEKVEAAFVVPVDALEKHLFRVLVRDVPDHDGRARVFSMKDPLQVYLELWVGILLRHPVRVLAGAQPTRRYCRVCRVERACLTGHHH